MALATRSEKIDIRVTAEDKATIVSAAELRRQSVSEFVLGSALDRANDALADRTRFVLRADDWDAFLVALDAPVRSMPRLSRLLAEPGVFDTDAPE